MQSNTILVSGSNGQLGHALQVLSENNAHYNFVFLTRAEADLSNDIDFKAFFEKYTPAFFINCAAYTAVDKAENEQDAAYKINALTVGVIASLCRTYNTRLIHISTDYVFNGRGTQPYTENQDTDPVNYYGYTKWMGEKMALANNPATVVIRTSWVYSYHGNNFVKTMLRLMKERSEIRVVSDQQGCPTYAFDLAETILTITRAGNAFTPGIYHYSNSGIITWYHFACAIRDLAGLTCRVQPITTEDYPTPARRPAYSAMNTSKIAATYHVIIKDWKTSLQECLQHLTS